jgi:hypothetical protein
MKAEKTPNGICYSDPTMVMIGFSRQTHPSMGGVSLFGSSVRNSQVISLSIYPADVERHLSDDWYHAKNKPLIEVLLSPLQFAELLTTMNIGFGIPGTMVRHGDQFFELPEYPSTAEQFKDEVQDDLKVVVDKILQAGKVIENLIDDPKPIGKQVRKELKELVASYRKLIEDHLPFVLTQFGRHMARTVTEAKANVDAFVENTIVKTGIAELKKRQPQIEGPGEELTNDKN